MAAYRRVYDSRPIRLTAKKQDQRRVTAGLVESNGALEPYAQ